MDGLLLIINRDFLNDLQKRGLQVNSLKIRFLIRDVGRKSTMFKPFSSLSSYNTYVSSVLNSANPLCSAGSFPIIESIEIENTNLGFKNTYQWYNITQERKLVESIAYDSFRKEFYESEVVRYKDLMNTLIDKYIKDIDVAISARLDSYVDPCYVDAGYVSPNYL